MGTTLRTKRLQNVLKIRVMETKREVCGRASTRGLLLLVILFSAPVTVLLQSTEVAPDVADRLRRELNGSTEEKRSALFEIRNLRSPGASLLAVTALSDSNEIVRATAASSVVFISKAEAARSLIPLLSDKAEFVRRETSYALGEVADKSATSHLVRIMRSDKILEVRTAAAVALGKIGDATAIESLVSILRSRPKDDVEFLRRSAARSIGQIAQIAFTGDDTVVTPQNFLPEKFKKFGTGDPTSTPFASAVETLIGVLRNNAESDDTRREAAFALGAIGDRKASSVLQTYVSSSDTYLAEISREALLKIERRNKVPASNDQ